MKFLLYVIISLSFVSCSSFSNDPQSTSDTSFSPSHIKGWRRIENSSMDYAYYKDSTKSFILVGSFCNKYKSSSNKDLLYSMLGNTQFDIVSTKTSTLFGREALHSIVVTKVDGIETYISTVLLRKNHCSYDFVLINSDKLNFDKDTTDFNKFVSGSNL